MKIHNNSCFGVIRSEYCPPLFDWTQRHDNAQNSGVVKKFKRL